MQFIQTHYTKRSTQKTLTVNEQDIRYRIRNDLLAAFCVLIATQNKP